MHHCGYYIASLETHKANVTRIGSSRHAHVYFQGHSVTYSSPICKLKLLKLQKGKHFGNTLFTYLKCFKFQKASFNTNRDIIQNTGRDEDGDASHYNSSHRFEKKKRLGHKEVAICMKYDISLVTISSLCFHITQIINFKEVPKETIWQYCLKYQF